VTGNEVVQARRERAACPVVAGSRDVLARRGINDAQALADDVRQVDPAQVWGRLELWRIEDPQRLIMLTVALAAMLDLDVSPGTALEWCDRLVGAVALQPVVREMRSAA
jgi:hypothetical protein